MYTKLLGFLLITCQVVLDGSSGITQNSNSGATATTTQPATLPMCYLTFPAGHVAYKIYEEFTTWIEARDRCISKNAYLAIADSTEKIKRINSMRTPFSPWIHVGIHRSNTANQWVRVDNDHPVTSVPWAKNNPGGHGSCAGISRTEDGLVNYECDWPGKYYVCEIPM